VQLWLGDSNKVVGLWLRAAALFSKYGAGDSGEQTNINSNDHKTATPLSPLPLSKTTTENLGIYGLFPASIVSAKMPSLSFFDIGLAA
jgi:hypothetical protein